MCTWLTFFSSVQFHIRQPPGDTRLLLDTPYKNAYFASGEASSYSTCVLVSGPTAVQRPRLAFLQVCARLWNIHRPARTRRRPVAHFLSPGRREERAVSSTTIPAGLSILLPKWQFMVFRHATASRTDTYTDQALCVSAPALRANFRLVRYLCRDYGFRERSNLELTISAL